MDVAVMRNARFIGLEDFLYLLRKDKVCFYIMVVPFFSESWYTPFFSESWYTPFFSESWYTLFFSESWYTPFFSESWYIPFPGERVIKGTKIPVKSDNYNSGTKTRYETYVNHAKLNHQI